MEPSKLSDHKLVKGKFITPFNQIPKMKELKDYDSWVYGRMPEYLWIGLILKHFGRSIGMKKLYNAITYFHRIAPRLETIRISDILKQTDDIQRQFYEYLVGNGAKKALSALTVFLTISYSPVFAEMFYCPGESIESRCKYLTDTMSGLMDHQSNESTDIRFVALYFRVLSGKLKMPPDIFELLSKYPKLSHDDEMMRTVRPSVRSAEMMMLSFELVDNNYLDHFWRCISEMTDCSLYAFTFPKEERNITEYMKNLHGVFTYLSSLFSSSAPLNDKMKVLLGISTYSYKRFKEAYDHNLFNTISGRSCIRVLIENYIMMKYLVEIEKSNSDIWRDFQIYGLGQYKLILTKHREINHLDESHFDEKYIEALVNEYITEEFINMDTSYFNKQNIRDKAISVGERDLYGLYYDYDSAFEHGLWGAIRESSLLKCDNPAHQYHCVPDIDDLIVLKSILPDCIMVMKKTLLYIDELYGIPEDLLNGVISFELKPIGE